MPDRSRSRELAVLEHQPPALHRVADDDQHVVVLERLREVVERALLGRRDGVLDRAERRHHHDRQLVVESPDVLEDIETVAIGEHEIEQDRIEGAIRERVQALRRRRRRRHAVALDDEKRLEGFANDFLVVDDEDGGGVGHESLQSVYEPPLALTATRSSRGIARRKRVPCPGLLSHTSVPPCSWTMP